MAAPKILILCGGRGKRLGKVTEKIPKPLIRIKDRPILELKMRNYLRQGFKDFIICIGYKGDIIKEAIDRFSFPAVYQFSDGGEPASILKRLYIAKDLFEKHVILTYGDTITDINLLRLFEAHRSSNNEATIVVAPIQNPFGLVEFDKDGKVTSFKEKPILNYYIGYAVINKSALEFAPQEIVDLPDGEGLVEFYKMLMNKGTLGTYYHSGIQITFNTEDELKVAQEKITSFYTAKEER